MSFASPAAIKFFEGQSEERPIVPLVDTFAATINQVSPAVFHSDATHAANGRQRACRLFDLDVVCTSLDRTLLCEALGAEVDWNDEAGQFIVEPVSDPSTLSVPSDLVDVGRPSLVLDVAERLVSMLDDEVAVLGGLPGPVATFNQLLDGASLGASAEAREVIRGAFGDLARAYGRAGVDAFLVAEQATGQQAVADVVETDIGALEMLANVAEFFDVPVLFVPEGYDIEATVQIVEDTAVDGVLLDSSDPASLADRFPDVRVGGGLTPNLLLEETPADIEAEIRALVANAPPSVFVASGTEVPPEVHPEKLQAVTRAAEAAA